MPTRKMKIRKVKSKMDSKVCHFVVKPYQRVDAKCKVQIFNGNDRAVKVTIKPIFIKTAFIIALCFMTSSAHADASRSAVTREDAIRTIVGEASDQGLDGMTAVGEVIRHRGSVKGFYGFRAMDHRSEPARVWERAAQAWERSETSTLVPGATLFENVHAFGFPRSWNREKVVCVAQIGDHWFFKEIK